VNLLDSLLDAIVRLDGDALVMHVGEKPYVVTTSEATGQFRGPLAWGQVELSSRVLTLEAVNGMLGQILPIDQRSLLDEYGATEYEVHGANDSSQRFTIIAARGGDDIWLEVRRHPKAVDVPGAVESEPRAAEVEAAIEEVEPAAPAIVSVPAAVQPTVEVGPETPAVEPAMAGPVVQLRQEAEPASYTDQAEVAVFHESAQAVEAEIPAAESVQVIEQVAKAAEVEAAVSKPADEPTVTPVASPLEPVQFSEAFTPTKVETPVQARIDDALTQPTASASPAEEEIRFTDHQLEPEHVLLTSEPDWGDDVMTEGDLSELLRASAAAVLTGARASAIEADGEPEAPYFLTAEESSLEISLDEAISLGDEIAVPAASASREEESSELPFTPDDSASAARAALLAEQEEFWRAGAPVSSKDEDLPAQSGASAEPTREYMSAWDDAAPLSIEEPAGLARESVAVNVPLPVADTSMGEAAPTKVTDEPTPILASAESQDADLPAASDEDADGDGDVVHPRPTAVIVPLSRHVRPEPPVDIRAGANTLERVLHLAAARGAATVYVVARSAPMVRIDGEFSSLEGEPAITTAVVERLTAELAPHGRDAASADAEWTIDVPEIGRVRCMTFRDHRGPGLIFRMVPQRAISADQLGLPAEVQALCSEADGLVLVAGGRGSGRSTLLTSFVDLINRTRSEHVITAETKIEFLHENRRSFISQREIQGDADAMAATVRAASREEPDVLIVEDLRTPELVTLALEGAQGGRLIFASVPAPSAVSAVERMIEMFPPERREKAQMLLAGTLRGVVSQVLLRKLRGGRVAAREVLLNTPAVANLIREGKTFQLPAALESGRRFGMMPLAESLATLVREGTVHPSHAYRKAPNREQFLAILRRDGVDTSTAERLA
jgi:twitching motility protein PilT